VEAIKDIVGDVIGKLQAKKSAKDAPELLLKEALLKKESAHANFRYLRKGILGVTVDSSGWLYHLNLQKAGLLAKLGKKSKAIKDIRFYIGEI